MKLVVGMVVRVKRIRNTPSSKSGIGFVSSMERCWGKEYTIKYIETNDGEEYTNLDGWNYVGDWLEPVSKVGNIISEGL
jgi:hypothetical protein